MEVNGSLGWVPGRSASEEKSHRRAPAGCGLRNTLARGLYLLRAGPAGASFTSCPAGHLFRPVCPILPGLRREARTASCFASKNDLYPCGTDIGSCRGLDHPLSRRSRPNFEATKAVTKSHPDAPPGTCEVGTL